MEEPEEVIPPNKNAVMQELIRVDGRVIATAAGKICQRTSEKKDLVYIMRSGSVRLPARERYLKKNTAEILTKQ